MEPPGTDPVVPASCSSAVVGYLRRNVGYGGLVMTDDMEMGALKAYSLSRAAVQGVEAGVDVFLVCHTEKLQLEVVDAIAAAMTRGELSRERVTAAVRRVDECCARYCAPAPEGSAPPPDPSHLVGTVQHRTRISTALKASRL